MALKAQSQIKNCKKENKVQKKKGKNIFLLRIIIISVHNRGTETGNMIHM